MTQSCAENHSVSQSFFLRDFTPPSVFFVKKTYFLMLRTEVQRTPIFVGEE
jgi:hypothetical protein